MGRVLIKKLKVLMVKKGRLSQALMLAEPGVPTPSTYFRRFGTIFEAYPRAG